MLEIAGVPKIQNFSLRGEEGGGIQFRESTKNLPLARRSFRNPHRSSHRWECSVQLITLRVPALSRNQQPAPDLHSPGSSKQPWKRRLGLVENRRDEEVLPARFQPDASRIRFQVPVLGSSSQASFGPSARKSINQASIVGFSKRRDEN